MLNLAWLDWLTRRFRHIHECGQQFRLLLNQMPKDRQFRDSRLLLTDHLLLLTRNLNQLFIRFGGNSGWFGFEQFVLLFD